MPANGYVRKYKATLVNGHEFYILANEHHQAAQDAFDEARKLGAKLKDVCVAKND